METTRPAMMQVWGQQTVPHLRCTPNMSVVILRVTATLARRQFLAALRLDADCRPECQQQCLFKQENAAPRMC